MLKTSSYISDDTRPVFVTGGDGTVIAQNKPARRMLGPGTGKYCWDVVGKLDGAKRAPCRRGCALELLASGLGHSQDAQFKLYPLIIFEILRLMLSIRNLLSTARDNATLQKSLG